MKPQSRLGCDGTCLRIIVAVEDVPQQLCQWMIGAFFKMQLMAHWSLCPASNQSHKFLACVHQLSRQLNQLTFSRSTYIEMIKSVIYLNSSREWICLILSTLYYFPFLVSQCPHLFFFPCYYGSHQFLGNACLF